MEKINKYFPQSIPHPGETLAEKLEEMEIGPKEFALRTGKPEKTIIAVLNGTSAITADMAVQFENATKIPANYWMNHQQGFDEFMAREKRKPVIQEALVWAIQFPLAEMIKKGWLPLAKSIEEKTMQMLAFFGFADHNAWEEYYFKQQLKVAFRISLAHTKEPYAISAWLRKGELQAAELNAGDYDEKRFKEVLPEIKNIMSKHPKNFFELLQDLCLQAGVKVVHTPCINKAPINGSTRWIKDTPLIQLTGRYKRNDIFWFTFFHEAGHILLHGKKDIFLENIEYSEKDLLKEKEANDFAGKWTFAEEGYNEISQFYKITVTDILEYAERYNTHPALIIGRLQHEKLLRQTFGKEFFEPVEFD
jgi:HTH-type transcriptional regulator/antitoxin HigA